MTRCGWVFKPKELQKSQEPVAGDSPYLKRMKKVSDAEVEYFVKMLKRSEYPVVEQLKKAPTKVSILSLSPSSEAHSNVLLKVLNESHILSNTNSQELEQIVGQVLATTVIDFIEDELTEDGTGHIKSLDRTVQCKGMIVARVLIYNCLALNVRPLITTDQLGVDRSSIREIGMMVRAFTLRA